MSSVLQREERLATGDRPVSQIIDVDVHPAHREPIGALFPYIPTSWRERLMYLEKAFMGEQVSPFRHLRPQGDNNTNREDARPPDGGPAGSSPAFLAIDHLDKWKVSTALLIDLTACMSVQAAFDHDLSALLASAFNDYTLDHWVDRDRRFRHALIVSPWDVSASVAEIHRRGEHPGVAGVFVPLSQHRLGNRRWYPLYEAAIEHGLPIVMHPSAGETVGFDGMARFAVGQPELWSEKYIEMSAFAQSSLTSLVMQGVFDRYRELKAVFVEFGFTWVLPHVWKMDYAWRQSRGVVPWMTRWPSEVVHDQVRFATQPVAEPIDGDEELNRTIEKHLADLLLYSSDYPHHDEDAPTAVFKKLSAETRKKIFSENAKNTLRLL